VKDLKKTQLSSNNRVEIAMNPAAAKATATALKYGPSATGGSTPRTPPVGTEKESGGINRNQPIVKVRPDQIKRFKA